jgi:hypothetical protein
VILTVDAGSRQTAGSMIVEAWKHGIEVEKLTDHQLEFTCAYDEKMLRFMAKYPNVHILHKELIKEVV